MRNVFVRTIRKLSTSSSYGWNNKTNPVPSGANWLNQISVEFSPYEMNLKEWLDETGQNLDSIKRDFEEKGFAVLRQIVDEKNLDIYKHMHDSIQNELVTPGRHDLGSHKEKSAEDSENIGQIMWPSDLVENSRSGPIHRRAYEISKIMMIPSYQGDEISFDFDMLIYKPALSATETPWHQDEAYWPSQIPDKQAITVWTALDRSTKENGAMWFVPKSHLGELHEHESAGSDSHVLKTKGDDINEHEAECVELEAGDAVFWHGRTLHYSRGNETLHRRRTYIVNFRPESCVKFERENGFDHLREGFDDYDTQMQAAGDAMRR